MKPRIYFASIDARDDGLVGHHPAWLSFGRRPLYAPNAHNLEIIREAVVGYLQGLKELQDKIRTVYGPCLIDDTDKEFEGYPDDKAKAENEFYERLRPFRNLYYT